MTALKIKYAVIMLLSSHLVLSGLPAFADLPEVTEVLAVLGMDQEQVEELAQGQPLAFALDEGNADELAMAVAWYLPVPLIKVAEHLRPDHPDPLDVDVTAHGFLAEQGGSATIAPLAITESEAGQLLEAEPGDEFNLSADELDSFRKLKKTLSHTPYRAIEDAVGEHWREILFRRFQAYRRGGTKAIASYARNGQSSNPALELQQAAKASPILSKYLPGLFKAWLDYPKALPSGAVEFFPWVEKNVEGRSATILKHRVNIDWNGGVLALTREFYAPHSFNSSQWITGCLPYLKGTVVFQQVRSFTDQVTGVASDVKHVVGRKILKDKMLKSFERLGKLVESRVAAGQ
jgi:hypothetical protein